MRNRVGFTIVELLIVVVVIGILAAITVVGFNGVQQRANNTAKITAVSTLVKLIRGYIVNFDAYPGTVTLCATADNQCTNGSGTVQTTDNTPLMTELLKIGTPPKVSNVAAGGSYGVQYIHETNRTFNGISAPIRLEYWLQGDNINCGVTNIQNNTALDATVSSTTGYTSSSGGRTVCWVRIGKSV